MATVRNHFALIAIIVALAFEIQAAKKVRFVPKLHGVTLCTDKKHYTEMNYVNISMHDDGFEYVNLNATLKTEVKTLTKLGFTVHRCIGGVSENQCEYFNTYSWTALICQGLLMKGMFWTPAMDSFTPQLKCPIKSGNYIVHDASLNYEQLSAMIGGMGWERYVWKIELQAFNDLGQMTVCGIGIGELRRNVLKPK